MHITEDRRGQERGLGQKYIKATIDANIDTDELTIYNRWLNNKSRGGGGCGRGRGRGHTAAS